MWFFPWTDVIKKKVCRYLLQRYIGNYITRISLDQLDVDFYGGKGSIENVSLSCEALNEICESQGWDFEVISGRIGRVSVNIPWNAPMVEDSQIEIEGLFIALRPLARVKDGTSMLESMWSSMSSSMQLAQECLEQEGDVPSAQSSAIEGLERFAQLIDNVLNRIKAKFVNTTIRLEYLAPDSGYGVAVIAKIENIEYENEAGSDPPEERSKDEDEAEHKSYLLSTYASHHLKLDGLTFYTEEFRIFSARRHAGPTDSLISSDNFLSTMSNLPDGFTEEQKTEIENKLKEDEDLLLANKPILFGRLSGQQEVRIKMKQDEKIPGPKVELEMTLGAITLFLSPRQLHLLIYLAEMMLYLQPASEKKETKREKSEEPPDRDFLSQQRFGSMSGGMLGLNNQGWSSAMDDLLQQHQQQQDQQTLFQSAAETSQFDAESVLSSTSSMTSSSMTSSQSSKPRRRGVTDDPEADISHFKLRIACIAAILLHEDVLVECPVLAKEPPLAEESVSKLLTASDRFFSSIDTSSAGLGATDILRLGKSLENACDHHNLKLIASPIILEGEEQRNTRGTLLKFTISIARADLREHLNDISVPLLEFQRPITPGGLPDRPEVHITYQQTCPLLKSAAGRRFGPPRSEIIFSLAPCLVEFDITILDRLSAVLYQTHFTSEIDMPTPPLPPEKKPSDAPHTEIKINVSNLDVKLRFPVTDLRPIHDSQRLPWWSRNVRPDFLWFTLQQMALVYALPASYEVTANQIDLAYFETERSQRIEIGRAVMRETAPMTGSRYGTLTPAVEYPKIFVFLPSEKALLEQQTKLAAAEDKKRATGGGGGGGGGGEDTDSDPTSGESIGLASTLRQKEPTPFSAKKVCRESETPHQRQTSSDPETLLIPGDRSEMANFIEAATKTSRLQIKVEFPTVSFQLKSKHVYEVLYNRLNSDLLMWEPSAPAATAAAAAAAAAASATTASFKAPPETNLLSNIGMMDSIYAPFTLCKSGIAFESSPSATGSESETDSDNNVFYSVCRSRSTRVVSAAAASARAAVADLSSASTFDLSIGQAMMTVYAPVRDSQNHVIPGQQGEFIVRGSAARLFTVAGFRGNRHLGYLCFQARSAELYHCGLVPVPAPYPPLRLITSMLPSHVRSTLYPTPKDLSAAQAKGSADRDQIALAIQIKACPDQSVKRIKLSAGIQLTTLRHHVALPSHTWLTQLIDMFDVVDYPVPGYSPLGVVTEMHLHLWDCAVDYRPLHLPYRAVANVGAFTVSSNIAASNAGCTLRFIAEDATLCLAPQRLPDEEAAEKEKAQRKDEHRITALPLAELVCVAELGLFEISLRLAEKVTPSFPKFDLRAALSDLHVRTCSDSGQALAKLIAYLAAEGDLERPGGREEETEFSSSFSSDSEANLLPVKQPAQVVPEVTQSQQQRVSSLMADAIEDCAQVPQKGDGSADDEDEQGVEVFFFPDEEGAVGEMPRKNDSIKRRFASDDSISVEDVTLSAPSSYRDDDLPVLHNYEHDDSESVNTEMRELLDFETSVMGSKSAMETEVTEPLPQVAKELGDVTKVAVEAGGAKTSSTAAAAQKARKISSDTDDDFCFIAEEERPVGGGLQEVPKLVDDPIRIVDNHFSVPSGKPDLLKAPKDFPMAVQRYTLCEMSVVWHMYGGHDFPVGGEETVAAPPKRSTASVSFSHMSEAYKMGVSYSKGSPSVQFGGASPATARLTWRTRGGTARKHDVLMEVQLSKVRFSHEIYPSNTEQASRQVLLLTELEIRDRLAASNINKFLYHPTVGFKPKGAQHMVVVKALHLRPNPTLSAQECCLRISALPLRLHIDQDSLLFLINYFKELSGGAELAERASPASAPPAPPPAPPVMMVEDVLEATQELHARKMVSENLMLLIDEEAKDKETPAESLPETTSDAPIYFRNIVFSPEVPIRLDYQGKRVEMSHGPLAGLLMGLGHLNCSEIRLKKINYRHGVLGVDRLIKFLIQEWLQDIKKRQLPKILGGVGPMYSFVQLFQGIWDLFWLPIEQYQKDGRIVRGLQRGAQSFTARTALAALEITTRIIHLLQLTAETAYDMVSPGPSVRRGRGNRKGKRKRLHPPQDIREGVANAYQIFKEGIGDTAHQIVETAALEHDQKGAVGAVGAVMRQIPPTVVRPIVLATQATSNVLGGVKNQLIPDARIEARAKWKDEEE